VGDAAHLLWADPALDQRRCEKSAAALIAVHRILGEDAAFPAVRDFLRLYEVAERADPRDFTRVWGDPAAYHWVRRSVHLLAARNGAALPRWEQAYCAALGASGPIQALEIHLHEFGRFVLGLGVVAGTDVRLGTPYETDLPLAIPGTTLALTGRGRVIIHGLVGGALDVTHAATRLRLAPAAGAPSGALCLESGAVVAVGAARLELNPYVFRLPGLSLFRELEGHAPELHARHADLVAEALRSVRRFEPAAFAHFERRAHVVALKPAREEDFGTLSTSELPGAFVCSVPTDPFALAADFIHELHHDRLFCIEETGPFFEPGGELGPDDPIEGENYYSPWRDTPRPLHGLLHALYVYLPVFRFWSGALRAGALEGARLDFARDQCARIPVQLRMGASQLRRAARWTPFGRELFEEMAREAAAMGDEAAALGATLDLPAVTMRASGAFRPVVDAREGRVLSVGETLLAHLTRCDVRGECAEEAALLASSRGADPSAAPT